MAPPWQIITDGGIDRWCGILWATTGQCQPSVAEGAGAGAGTYDGLLHLLGLGLGDLREALPLRRDDLPVAVANHLLVILSGELSVQLILYFMK